MMAMMLMFSIAAAEIDLKCGTCGMDTKPAAKANLGLLALFMDQEDNSFVLPHCPSGVRIPNIRGNNAICNPNANDCTSNSKCVHAKNKAVFICCSVPMPACAVGLPLQNEFGQDIFCGVGLNHQECPFYSQCTVSGACCTMNCRWICY